MTMPRSPRDLADPDWEWHDPDPHRHCDPGQPCGHVRAEADWSRTRAALDGRAGDSIYARAELEDEAWWDDWEPFDELE